LVVVPPGAGALLVVPVAVRLGSALSAVDALD
jgi:hypothetical protein